MSNLQSNFDYCARLVREADRDRYLATLFAPAAHRNALFALYAFNLEVTRVCELAREPMAGEIRFQWWREIISGERHEEAAGHPVAAAIQDVLKRYLLRSEQLVAIIDAHGYDLYDQPMANVDELDNYAARTQGEIFHLAGTILGAEGDATKPLTRYAGIAFGLTRILSDLSRHVVHQQMMLPLDLLHRHAVNAEDVLAHQETHNLKAALAELRDHVRHHLAAAEAEPAFTSSIWPALLPVALVGPQLRLMDRSDYHPFDPALLSAVKRQWLLWRAARNPRRIFAR